MLTSVEVKSAKVREKQYKLFDGKGLFLLVAPAPTKPGGVSKTWRLKYRYGGREKLLALGVYPQVTLAEARNRCEDARKLLANGQDPGQVKKTLSGTSGGNTFEGVAREWHRKYADTEWSVSHARGVISRLAKHVFPFIGHRDIGEITAQEVLTVFRRIETAGHLETIRRTLPDCSRVFRYAVITGRAETDPSYKLIEAFPRHVTRHFSTILDPERVGALLRDIEAYEGHFVTKCALQLAPLVFLRSSELRNAEWSEIDLEKGMWRIPIARMKRTRRDKESYPHEVHFVPLAHQAVDIFRNLHPLTGHGKLVFPGPLSRGAALSDMTLTSALRRLGYGPDEMHFHGFRAMARTLIREKLNVNPEVIERQLSHAIDNPLGKAYDRTSFIPERTEMMQRWADYLDELRGA